jgi:hypothetical protein
VDPVIWCPPTFVGNSGIEHSNGHRGFALLFFVLLLEFSAIRSAIVVMPAKVGIQYAGASRLAAMPLEYWITRFRE